MPRRAQMAASSPPAMTASVPASAAGGPPETGASIQPMPVSAQAGGEPPGGLDLGGRMIDQDLAGRRARGDAVRAEHRGSEIVRGHHADCTMSLTRATSAADARPLHAMPRGRASLSAAMS